ncbi:MAG: OmpW family protein [Pseudomonadota bacterium]
MKQLLTFALAASALTPVSAWAEAGDFLVRARAIYVAPTESAGPVLPSFPDGSVSVDNAIMPELDFTYMITDNIGAELILATTNHDISGEMALESLGEIADTWVLPPTLTLQYHFLPDNNIRPYVGAGINWTIFYSEGTTDSLTNALPGTTIDLENSFGWSAQVGVDIDITERYFFNVDVKFVDINTTANLTTPGVGVNSVDVDLDPIIVGVGFGLRF